MTSLPTSSSASRSIPNRVPVVMGVVTGVAALLATIGLWWLGYQAGFAPFPPFDLADLMIRSAPGDMAVWAIANLQFRAQDLALLGGLAIFIAAGAIAGLILRLQPDPWRGAALGLAGALICVVLGLMNSTILTNLGTFGAMFWFSITLCGPLALAASWLDRVRVSNTAMPGDPEEWVAMNAAQTRRSVLRSAVMLAVAVGGGGWLGGVLARNVGFGGVETEDNVPLDTRRADLITEGATADPLPTAAPANTLADDFEAPDGVRERMTSIEDFYVVDISTRKPAISDDTWTLHIHGLVEEPLRLRYVDLLDMPAVEQYGNLMCISYTHDNDLIGCTRWTGVPLRDILQRTGIQDGAVDVVLRGAGGYSDSITVAKALEAQTLLAYGMDGQTLPRDHGFPCRLYVPDIYGEKNVKWLQEIEVVDYDYQGYWQERGWSDTATISTLATVDTPSGDVSPGADGVVPLGGIAFAGSRGVLNVQVRINDEWVEADLEPYDPELVWQRWKLDWRPAPGEYSIAARATDGNGIEQDTTPRDPYPDGMTGLHEVRVTVS